MNEEKERVPFTNDQINEYMKVFSEKVDPIGERLLEILRVKSGREWQYGNEIGNVSGDGDIMVVGVEWDYGDGDTDYFTFKIPVELLNKEEADWIEWWKKLEVQGNLAKEIEGLKSSISSLAEKEMDMLKAYHNLQDPEWIFNKIQEVNAAINDNDRKRNEKKQTLTGMESKIDRDIAKCVVENLPFGARGSRGGTPIKTVPKWRDLCD